MTPEEVREYAKNFQEAERAKRALRPFNEWYMGKCIRKIDRSIKNKAEDGATETTIRLFGFLPPLYDGDKKYLEEHYRGQGYYVSIGTDTIRIGWSVGVPWWAY